MALFDFLLQVKHLLNATLCLKSHVSTHGTPKKVILAYFLFLNGEEMYFHSLNLFLVVSYD